MFLLFSLYIEWEIEVIFTRTEKATDDIFYKNNKNKGSLNGDIERIQDCQRETKAGTVARLVEEKREGVETYKRMNAFAYKILNC